jgi:hypothetical protein
MTTEQPTLFDRRKYMGVPSQVYQIEPPTAEQTIMRTLPAYYTYLQSGDYSRYTPADFTSDIKKLGMFLKEKPLHTMQTTDIQQWIGELRGCTKSLEELIGGNTAGRESVKQER